VLVSHYLERYFAGLGIALPDPEVIYNGIALAPFEAVSRAPFSDGETPLVLMVARLDTAKDHATLVEAAAILGQRGIAVRLRLAGDGPLREAIAQQARALGVALEFAGYVDDLPSAYAAADIVALATHYEGFGLTVVEAMAAARPVVATAVAAIPELIDDGVHGRLVPPRDAAAFADAIAALVGDRARAVAMGRAGRVRAAERFALAPSVRAFEAHVARTCARIGIV
jgi:glycosyltransferase involved in cell wall biosynthesis